VSSNRFFAAVVLAYVATGSVAHGSHITSLRDVNGFRDRLVREGYLDFGTFRIPGEERTGWTDIRHPAYEANTNLAITDRKLGFDRSDHQVKVSNKLITVSNQAPSPQIARDYNFAGQIYAQAGVSVLSTGSEGFHFGNAADLPVNISFPGAGNEQNRIQGTLRQGAPIVNNYYVKSLSRGSSTDAIDGSTLVPSEFANHGTMIADVAGHDVFAHELGHFLLDEGLFPGEKFHSPLLNDLMADGADRKLPGPAPKYGPLAASPNGGPPFQPGKQNGPKLGIVDHFIAALDTGGTQISKIRNSPFVTNEDNHPHAGDRADFDWVEDNFYLEAIGGKADNHPDIDKMIWSIGAIGTPHPDPDHDHGDWAELPYDAFQGSSFRVFDVISQISRYTDMDISTVDNLWSMRESALDYSVEVSADAVNWITLLEPSKVFIQGWTSASDAENYLARWQSPIAAKYVRIAGLNTSGHDGNTQIDAIIAGTSQVPEPGTALLVGAAFGIAALWRASRGCSVQRGDRRLLVWRRPAGSGVCRGIAVNARANVWPD
jgi:hypothetical protein